MLVRNNRGIFRALEFVNAALNIAGD